MATRTDRVAVRTAADLLALEGAEFVRAVYRTFLQRDPDPGGFVAYLNKLAAGADKHQIAREVQLSPEGLLRRVELQGIEELASSDAGRAAATPDDGLSAVLALHGMQFVQGSYLLLLGRQADPAGLAYYCDRMSEGIPKVQILAEIAKSDEYVRRGKAIVGVDKLLRQQRRLRNPIWRAAARLSKHYRPSPGVIAKAAEMTTNDAPAAALGSRAGAEESRHWPGMAQPADPARALLITLPSLSQRDRGQ